MATRTSEEIAGAVVVGIDGSDDCLQALDWGADQARLEDRPLTLIHVVTLGTIAGHDVDTPRIASAMQAEGRSVLHRAYERAQSRGVEIVHSALVMDDPRSVLLDASHQAHLLVVGSRGRGPVASLLLGSVSVALTQHARCPVVVRRPGTAPQPSLGVLVATDGLPHAEPAVVWGARLAVVRALPLTLVRTVFDGLPPGPVPVEDPAHQREWAELRGIAQELRHRHPSLEASLRVERGLADEALVRAASGMDVIVLGPHTRRSLLGILDLDVTTHVVERAPCVVAVVQDDRLTSASQQVRPGPAPAYRRQ